jgi:MFS family permease
LADPSGPASPIVPPTLLQQLTSRELKRLSDALRHKDLRFFLFGSFLSNIGSWMQSVAQAWLVLQLSNSAFFLGLDGFANTLPIAIFALWGGVVADRFDRRKMLLGTQWVLLALAVILGVLIQWHKVTVWQVIMVSFCTGLTQSIAWPVYQAVLANIVQREHMSNAIALNSTQFNLARMIGPVLGAVAFSTMGMSGCFYANAVSFLAVIYALYRVGGPTNRRAPDNQGSLWDALREGITYLSREHRLKWLLILMAVSTLLGVPMMTLLPVFARDILKEGATGYGIMMGAFGVGAVAAGVLVAILGDFHGKGRFIMRSMCVFIAALLIFSFSRNFLLSVICLIVSGFSMVSYTSVVNTTIQNAVPDHLRGRAMSMFVLSFGGCMPFGSLMAGYLAKLYTAPVALLGQGLALAVFTGYVYRFKPDIRSA